jgi:RNA 3'-terminal phosphate cyclase (ATP)
MLCIDGSKGEGGGQVLRTALGLSLVTGQAFTIKNIRGKRKKPGLLRQHLTAVLAAAEIGGATVQGAAIKSDSLTFEPGTIAAGTYTFSIGTAGSCTLVLQAIMPALLKAGKKSYITLEGGTHNPFAPSFDYLETTFFSVLQKMGVHLDAELIRPGFYPAGGGKMRICIDPPKSLLPIRFDYLSKTHCRARAVCAELPAHIGQRELKKITKKLNLAENQTQLTQYHEYGPGNVVSIFVDSDQLTETFVGFGQTNIRAERVAGRIIGQVRKYLDTGVTVGPYLADQLLVPLALAGKGKFLTCRPTEHALTNIEVIQQFLDMNITVSRVDEQVWQIAL